MLMYTLTHLLTAASISKRIYDQLNNQHSNNASSSDAQRNLSLIPPLPPSLDSVAANTVIPPLSPLGTSLTHSLTHCPPHSSDLFPM